MKRLLLVLAASSLVLAPAAFAAKGDRKKAANTASSDLVKKFDANANAKIDGAELEAVRKDFAASADLNIKALDKDHDGKLSDTEIEAMNTAAPKKIKKKKN